MKTETTHAHASLTPEQQTQWHADVAALRHHVAEQTVAPLKMGDLFLTLRERWGRKVAVLAREAGVSPFLARQRARIAQVIGPDSELRGMALPFSILRLLAPLPDPLPWAEHAQALQEKGELRVRQFARDLEEAGLRHPRPKRSPTCATCRHRIVDETQRLTIRGPEETVTLCSPGCAAWYFKKLAWYHPTDPADRGAGLPPGDPSPTPDDADKRDSGSQPPPPDAAKRDSGSQTGPDPRRTEEGFRASLPGGLVVMTRRRPM